MLVNTMNSLTVQHNIANTGLYKQGVINSNEIMNIYGRCGIFVRL